MDGQVIHNPAQSRFEMALGDEIAVAYYKIEDGRVALLHTEGPSTPVWPGIWVQVGARRFRSGPGQRTASDRQMPVHVILREPAPGVFGHSRGCLPLRGRLQHLCSQPPRRRTGHGLRQPVPDQEAAAEDQRGEERGGATGGAEVPGVQPGYDTPDTGNQSGAADQRAEAIPHRMARLLRLLLDPTGAYELGGVDSPKITLVSLAAMAERAQPLQGTAPSWPTKAPCRGCRRFADGILAHVRTPGGPTGPAQPPLRLAQSPPTLCICASLIRSTRRGT